MIFTLGCTSSEKPFFNKEYNVQNDPLSYGNVKAKVKTGITTQNEIMNLFGAPNITTINSDGKEVWMYDRISSQSHSEGWSEARRFSIYFGFDLKNYNESTTNTRSTRTLIVIITFNKENKVETYSARSTQF